MIEAARQEREATGENPLPPVRQWPVRLLDAARILHDQRLAVEHAYAEASSNND